MKVFLKGIVRIMNLERHGFFFNCSGVYLILRLWCGCFFRLSGLFQIIDPQRTGPRQETLS